MKKTYFLLALVFSVPMLAQAPDILWQKSIGGTATEMVYALVATDDGGCVTAGWSNSNTGLFIGNHGGYDVVIVKFDSDGDIEWQKLYGGSGNDTAKDIKKTADGGYIVVGSSNSSDGDATGNHGDNDYWIIKLAATGDVQWQKSIGGSQDDRASRIIQTGDGGYLVSGESYSTDGDRLPLLPGIRNRWIVKLTAAGVISWHTSFWANTGNGMVELAQQPNGNFAVGYVSSQPIGVLVGGTETYYNNAFIKLFDAAGNELWSKNYGGSYQDNLESMAPTTDGGYIVAGHSLSNDLQVSGHHGMAGADGASDMWVFRIDALGNLVWQKSLGGTYTETAQGIAQTADGGYIVCGHTASSNNGDVSGNHSLFYSDIWVVRLSSSGNLLWQKCLGGTDSEFGFAVAQASDGGFFASGWTVSTDGDVTQSNGGYDGWVVKLGTDGLFSVAENEFPTVAIVPNPVHDRFSIRNIGNAAVSIIDATGKVVQTATHTGVPIDIQGLQSGFYLIRIDTNEGSQVAKILKY